MHKILIILVLLLPTLGFSIDDTLEVDSKISNVTVFFTGAQINRDAPIELKKGKYVLKFKRLPHEINAQSIQVEGVANCEILSVKHQLAYPIKAERDSAVKSIEEIIEKQEIKLKEIRNKYKVFELEEKLLLDNSDLNIENKGASISTIKEAANFYRQRLNEIKREKLKLSIALDNESEKLQELYADLNKAIAQHNKVYSEIWVSLGCEKDIKSTINIAYYIPSAGWTPFYDFRVDDITNPLSIIYNADVFQSSGEDWENVNLELSTNNPTLSGTIPELKPWYLGRRSYTRKPNDMEGSGAIRGRVYDAETKEVLPFANVSLHQNNALTAGTTTDFDGQYLIKPIPAGNYDLLIKYVGYQPTKIEDVWIGANKITFQDIHLNQGAALEEMEVIAYSVPLIRKDGGSSGGSISRKKIRRMPSRGSRAIASSIGGVRGGSEDVYIDGVKVRESVNFIANTLKTNATSIKYKIEIPYTIPSDGKNYSIKIKESSIPVNYVYHSVPKLESDVFLIAEIVDWADLNLLSGKANIYFQGTYTGEAYLDVEQTADTLNLPLGRDKSIVVQREFNKELNDKRFLGANVKETIAWDIRVRNNKGVPIKIVIEDQYPISERESIEVERMENSNATVEDKTGKLSWTLQLDPNENKVIQYTYAVKYPSKFDLKID